jgi:hypothetical protein
MMNIDAFLLCDAATDSQGKLNVLGAFDTIFAKSVPVVHPQCAVAIRIRLSRSEQGEHKFAVHFVDANGKHIIPQVEGGFNVALNDTSGSVNLIFNIQGLKLESYGEYGVTLLIDGKDSVRLPLFVKEAPIK